MSPSVTAAATVKHLLVHLSLAVVTAAGAVGCGGGTSAPESVLLVTFDTVRRDAVGFHGAEPSPTPTLDRLAAQAVVFEDAYAVTPLTLPAHASLLTGLYPTGHGIRDNGAGRLPEAARTLAEALRERGYGTGASVAAFVLDPCFGLGQGFETYSSPPRALGAQDVHYAERRADEVVDAALEDLRALAARDAPFFYWLHFYDPHAPYDAPGAATGGDDRTRYAAEIRFADAQFGRVVDELERLGIWDDVVVLVTSDHGEGLDDGNEPTHGTYVDDPEVRIPLFLRHSDLAPRRVTAQVSQVDVMPTLLELLEVPADARDFDGRSLAALARGEIEALPERTLAIECYRPWISHGWAPFEGVVDGRWKYVRSARRELFDRAADPGESVNVFDPAGERSRSLAERSEAHFRNPEPRFGTEAVELSASDRTALAGLGYTGVGSADAAVADLDLDALPDTYAKGPVLQRFMSIQVAIAAGATEDAIREMRALVELEPENPDFLVQLASLLLDAGRAHADEAETLVRRAIELRSSSAQSHWLLAYCLTIRAQRELEHLRDVLRRGQVGEADAVRAERQRLRAAAQAELRAVLALEPAHPEARSGLALELSTDAGFFWKTGRREEALPLYKEVITLLDPLLATMAPDHPERRLLEGLRADARTQLGR